MIRDMSPSYRRVVDRQGARAEDHSKLTEARRTLSRLYNNYFAGIETGEQVQIAERQLKVELSQQTVGRATA